MTTLTIPKELTKEKDLVVIPKRVYLKFLSMQKKATEPIHDLPKPPKKIVYFTPTTRELKILKKARKNLAEGKYLTLDEFNAKVNRWLSK